MDDKTVLDILDAIRGGAGLQDEIKRRGLPLRSSLKWFQDNATSEYYEAKKEAKPDWKTRSELG